MASTLRQRSVVSSFICKPASTQEGIQVAIFKRSQDVSTYKGKWAACSGSIETTDPSPEEAAKREIREETMLKDADITLYRRGKPFSLIDEDLNTEWTIHPFAWMMWGDSREIKFDWEHTEYAFIDPKDLKDYDTVPNLEFGIRRCLAGPETGKALTVLRDDHESGAQAMGVVALKMLLLSIRGQDIAHVTGVGEFWKELRMIAWHLAKNGRPSMGAAIEAALFKALDNIRAALEGVNIAELDAESVRVLAETSIEATIASRNGSLEVLANYFVEFIAGDRGTSSMTIVTLSSSGTIKKSLLHLIWTLASQERSIKLCVLESRPKFEGINFVNTLLEELEERYKEQKQDLKLEYLLKSLEVEIVSDASVGTVVRNADYVLLGADKVLPNGDTSNKIGSLTTAIVTKTLKPDCKVVALFETDKITGSGDGGEHFRVEYNDQAEVTSAWPSKALSALTAQISKGFRIDVKNVYFELVPAEYIDCYVSEKGVLAVNEIKQLSIESEKLEKRLFVGL